VKLGQAAREIQVSVKGVKMLLLIADSRGDINYGTRIGRTPNCSSPGHIRQLLVHHRGRCHSHAQGAAHAAH